MNLPRRPIVIPLLLVLVLSLPAMKSAQAQADAVNQIVNGDFATNLAGWSQENVEDLTSNWSSQDAASSASSGSFRGEAKGGTTWPTQYDTHGTVGWQCLDVEPDRVYRLSMHARGDLGAGSGARGALYAHDISGQPCPTMTHVGDFPPSGSTSVSHRASQSGWEHKSTEFRTGPSQNRIQAGLHVRYGQVNVNGGWNANIWFDNLVVGKVRPDVTVDLSVSETSLRPLQTVTLNLSLASLTSNAIAPEVRVFHADRLELLSSDCPGNVVDGQEGGQHRFLWSAIPDHVDPYQRTCTITARANSGVVGPFSLRAAASCGECNIETRLDNNERTIAMSTQAAPDVGVQTLAFDAFPNAGTPVTLAVGFRNHGTLSATSSVTVALSPGLVFVPSDQDACANFVVSGALVSGAVAVDAGVTVNCVLTFDIPASQAAAQLSATVTTGTPGDYDSTNDTADASTRIVRLRVNRSIDGWDRDPGDGTCEQLLGQNDCSLRAAVMEANALGGRRTIEVPYSATPYQLTTTVGDDDALKGDIDIRVPMILHGEADANGALPQLHAAFPSEFAHRIFSVAHSGSSSTIIRNLRLVGQNLSVPSLTGDGDGGLVHHGEGTLILRDVELRNGRAELGNGRGGAVFSAGTLTLERALLVDNRARRGGGLALFADDFVIATVVDSEFDGNSTASVVGRNGGAISAQLPAGILGMNRISVHGNSSHLGGGLNLSNILAATLLNSTISGNDAGLGGGGIHAQNSALSIGHSTLVHNAAARGNDSAGLGGGIFIDGGDVQLFSSILAFNLAQTRPSGPFTFPHSANCDGLLGTQGYNSLSAVTTDSECDFTATTGDAVNVAPNLGDLGDNGGPTSTHALLSPGSEVDLGDPDCRAFPGGATLTVDQRGALRPADGDANGSARCDKGAYEVSEGARITVTKTGEGAGTVTSTPANIFCGPNCSAVFSFESEVVLTASATSGSEFVGWEGACAEAGTAQCTVQAIGEVDVIAVFEPVSATRDLQVVLDGPGGGSVTSNPSGISCPAKCDAAFETGSSVSLMVETEMDSVFLGFFGGGCNGSTDPCVVDMSLNHTVTAVFDIDANELSVSMDGDGVGRVVSNPVGIDCPGDCEQIYPVTDEVSLSALPAVGSSFAGWSGACSGTGPCEVSMDLGPRAVTATFTLEADALFSNGFE